MEQKADLQEQPKLIYLWLDALLSRADRCRLALLKLWLNCTQQTGYLMTGALLTMSTVQAEALAWCRLPLIVVGSCTTKAKYVWLERAGPPGVEWGRAARVPELRIVKESAKKVSACKISERPSSGTASPKGKLWLTLSSASTTVLDQNTVFCDREKRRTIATWLVAVARAKGSRDGQLRWKQPLVSEELCWWHRGSL